jgi:hypothetical protein
MPYSSNIDERVLREVVERIVDRTGLIATLDRIGGSNAPPSIVVRHEGRVHVFAPVPWSDAGEQASWSDTERRPLVVADRFDASQRQQLRSTNRDHADASGSLWLRRPHLLVDVGPDDMELSQLDGPRTEAAPGREAAINPFARRASLVLRAMFAGPTTHEWTQGELRQSTGVSKGFLSQVLDTLVDMGHVTRTAHGRTARYRIADPVALLLDWQARGSRPGPVMRAYRLTDPMQERETILAQACRDDVRFALALHSAGRRLAPHVITDVVHAYVPRDSLQIVARRLAEEFYLAERDGDAEREQANLQLLVPRDGPATFFDAREIGGLPVVSPVQLFLDLAHWPVRGPEAIEALVKGRLGDEIGLVRAQRRRLIDFFA